MASPNLSALSPSIPLAINCCPEFCKNPECPFSPKELSVLRIQIFPNLKEEILTIRSPTAEENNDSGIENNRNSSSHSPSTSLDFSPRSTDFLSPKSHTSSTENLPPPPPPPSQPPAESSPLLGRHLDQVLVPIPTTGAPSLHRPSPLEETVDYPPPPHHLRVHSTTDKSTKNQTDSEILTPNKARISATIPSSSYLREHTKVEPFVAQSIREHQIVTSKLPETNVDLTVELNREQKAIVSTSKFPNRESSAYKRSEMAANSTFPSDTLNSQYRFASTEEYPQEKNNRTTSYYQYRSNQQSESSINRSTPTTQGSRNLSHSVSTPAVSGNSMISNTPSQSTTTLYRAVDIPFDDSLSSSVYQPPKRDKDGLIAITIELGAQPVHKGFGFSVNCEKRHCLVDAVVVGTPADKQGLQIGDRIDSINGEKTADQFPSAINRAIHEATRMGEIHLRIERKDAYGHSNTREPFGGSSRSLSSSDYRVTSLHDKVGPGKLSDFVPEVERSRIEDSPRRRAVDSEETPRTIRNYQVSTNELGYRPQVHQTQHQNSGSSYKPAEINYVDEHNSQSHVETRDWRDVINQQRQPAPGHPVDNQKIREVTASMSNLPSIIDRKHEESKKLVREQNDYQYQSRDWKQSQPEMQPSRTEVHSNYNSLGYKPKSTNNFNNNSSYKSNTLREEISRYDDYQSKTLLNSSTTHTTQKEAKEYTPSGYKEDKQDNVVAVSGKHRCAHCSTELGRGAAMIVESLNLYYHLACFKCFVCKTPLGSGATGTDVRVREGRLHCQSCYSNDKLQLSKV